MTEAFNSVSEPGAANYQNGCHAYAIQCSHSQTLSSFRIIYRCFVKFSKIPLRSTLGDPPLTIGLAPSLFFLPNCVHYFRNPACILGRFCDIGVSLSLVSASFNGSF